MTVHWYWGISGSGKTYTAVKFIADNYYKGNMKLVKSINNGKLKWFDWYRPLEHKGVIFDDFRKGDCDFNRLLRLCD